jgi:hypothetical protein
MASTFEFNTWTTSNTYGTFIPINTIKTLIHRALSLITKNTLKKMYPCSGALLDKNRQKYGI